MAGTNSPQPHEQGSRQSSAKDIDWEIAFFEGIIEASPDYVEVLMNLGNLYTKRGDWAKGLDVDKRLVRLRPDDAIVHYNLACSLSLLEELEASFVELQKAVELGYDDYAYMLKDDDLENARKDPRFTTLMQSFRNRS